LRASQAREFSVVSWARVWGSRIQDLAFGSVLLIKKSKKGVVDVPRVVISYEKQKRREEKRGKDPF
jgi:hypothetical protein